MGLKLTNGSVGDDASVHQRRMEGLNASRGAFLKVTPRLKVPGALPMARTQTSVKSQSTRNYFYGAWSFLNKQHEQAYWMDVVCTIFHGF